MTKRNADRAMPAPETQPTVSGPSGKLGVVTDLLRKPQGVTIAELVTATGWMPHSIRGAMAGALKKKHGLNITSEKADGVRRYRIIEAAA